MRRITEPRDCIISLFLSSIGSGSYYTLKAGKRLLPRVAELQRRLSSSGLIAPFNGRVSNNTGTARASHSYKD